MLTYNDNVLYIDAISLKRIAEKYGTPVFVYSRAMIKRNIMRYKKAFASIPHIICYAVKANSNLSILKELGRLGAGADIVSGGELFRARKAGISPERIVFAGVGKTDDEIKYALRSRILMLNVESFSELKNINRIAKKLKTKAPVSFRINPDIDAQTHHHITTGKKENKFGIHFSRLIEHYIAAQRLSHINLVGLQVHIGSQLLVLKPYVSTVKKLLEIVEGLSLLGIRLKYLDIGGGLGIRYHNENPPTPAQLARAVKPMIRNKGLTLIVEPGRSVVGEAGCLLTRVLYRKYTGHKHFIIVDAAMNDLIRPAMYNSYHTIVPVIRKRNRRKIVADIVGPICETGDFLARGRRIQEPDEGDLYAVLGAGAYAFSMSSQYNSRPRAAEVMISGRTARLIRERETYNDLVRQEVH